MIPLLTFGGGAALATFATIKLERHRVRAKRKQKGFWGPYPIPKITPHKLDPCFEPDELGPTKETEIAFNATYKVRGGVTDFETWILCSLAKKSMRIFEFGTCTGKTTYLMARNAPQDGKVITLTLHPDAKETYQADPEDLDVTKAIALIEAAYTDFYYTGTDAESKIEQIFCDSKTFDETPYEKSMDLIFVDGSHARSYVKSDSEKALKMIKPGGLILWHDYRGPKPLKEVFEELNALGERLPLQHVEGTALVAYRAPTT